MFSPCVCHRLPTWPWESSLLGLWVCLVYLNLGHLLLFKLYFCSTQHNICCSRKWALLIFAIPLGGWCYWPSFLDQWRSSKIVKMNWDCIAPGNGEILPGAVEGCWGTEKPPLWPSRPRRDEEDTLLANSQSKVWQPVPKLGKWGLDFATWVCHKPPGTLSLPGQGPVLEAEEVASEQLTSLALPLHCWHAAGQAQPLWAVLLGVGGSKRQK